MRILGYIDHPKIKITVFEDNNKVIAQCEDGLCQLTYKFRQGGLVDDIASVQRLFNATFVATIEQQIEAMQSSRRSTLSKATAALDDEFDTII